MTEQEKSDPLFGGSGALSGAGLVHGETPVGHNGGPGVGDEEGPSHWVAKHGDYLFRYAYARLGQRELAEDLVQETLMAAIEAWKGFEGRSTVRTWLTSILKRKIIDHIRKASTRHVASIPVEEALEGFNSLGIWNIILKDWAKKPDELLEQQRFMEALRVCIQDLPERSRYAFTLATVEGLGTAEICDLLKVTKENLWVLLHRARMALRRCVEGRTGSIVGA